MPQFASSSLLGASAPPPPPPPPPTGIAFSSPPGLDDDEEDDNDQEDDNGMDVAGAAAASSSIERSKSKGGRKKGSLKPDFIKTIDWLVDGGQMHSLLLDTLEECRDSKIHKSLLESKARQVNKLGALQEISANSIASKSTIIRRLCKELDSLNYKMEGQGPLELDFVEAGRSLEDNKLIWRQKFLDILVRLGIDRHAERQARFIGFGAKLNGRNGSFLAKKIHHAPSVPLLPSSFPVTNSAATTAMTTTTSSTLSSSIPSTILEPDALTFPPAATSHLDQKIVSVVEHETKKLKQDVEQLSSKLDNNFKHLKDELKELFTLLKKAR